MNGTAGLVFLGGLLLMFNLGEWADRKITPTVTFGETSPPPAPDYSDLVSWSALPELDDEADAFPPGSPAINQRQAPADVFYIHPTSYVGNAWNAPTSDERLNDATDQVATGIQASAFNSCCAIYAPRYRQANGTAFYRPSADGDRAIDLAYQDVLRAFDNFNTRRGEGRPFDIVSHSQGSVLAERLLYEAVSGTPQRQYLVAAYVIGGRMTTAGLAERAPDLSPCHSPDDVGCVIAYNARSPTHVPSLHQLYATDPRTLLCTNPLTWRSDGVAAGAELNLGAVFLESHDPSPHPGFADAQCEAGILRVTLAGTPPRNLPSKILDRLMGEGNYHPIEYQIFFMNLRANVNQRLEAYLTLHPAQH